jgi:hypothetical protein
MCVFHTDILHALFVAHAPCDPSDLLILAIQQ